MEITPLETEQIGIKTLEKHLIKSDQSVSLKIGLPKEYSNDELRISLTPGGVSVLKANGHDIIVEKGAGEGASFSDREYAEAGAEIVYSTEDLFKRSELISKIAPLSNDELGYIQPNQILLSALHLGGINEDYLKKLSAQNVTAIGYEFIKGSDKEFPIVRMMHEITG